MDAMESTCLSPFKAHIHNQILYLRLFLKFIFRCSVVNEIIRKASENKFKEALNIRPDYEYGHKY